MRNLLLLLLAAWLVPATARAEPLALAVSIPPLQTLAEQLGGDRVRVTVLLPPGESPATYDPTPRQLARLADARLYVRIGVPFEAALLAGIQAVNPSLVIHDAREGLTLRGIDGEEDGHGHGRDDPHVWLDPLRLVQIAGGLRDRLATLDPQHRDHYQRNFSTLQQRLEQLDRALRQRLAPVSGGAFMTYHPSWGYFADAYGLRQLAIEHGGHEPGGRTLAGLVEQGRRERVRVIFVQRQFSQVQARALAGEIGARVVAIDPLAADYAENLKRVADAVAGALQDG